MLSREKNSVKLSKRTWVPKNGLNLFVIIELHYDDITNSYLVCLSPKCQVYYEFDQCPSNQCLVIKGQSKNRWHLGGGYGTVLPNITSESEIKPNSSYQFFYKIVFLCSSKSVAKREIFWQKLFSYETILASHGNKVLSTRKENVFTFMSTKIVLGNKFKCD
jgi:hypothetical protein